MQAQMDPNMMAQYAMSMQGMMMDPNMMQQMQMQYNPYPGGNTKAFLFHRYRLQPVLRCSIILGWWHEHVRRTERLQQIRVLVKI
jgi:hypothetical protein